ncbi:helix-turn-helix transcriptional regulator [Croceicoccus estronivorus]|uniref:response regulator transcription factor n=1 Tax=Croceicoccus estronivorus TaxID=1172626 RepID=UPI00083443CE|nr:LuxR C-terminal-related transcriptional regulator [Croceicoccus estronivorus]OCC24999.1 helix-turn-helix transcriptional regulator [Croceicoccus estronivorus]
MEQGLVIHFLGGTDRFRAEGAQSAFLLGHHAEVYETVEELLERPPRKGFVIAYDDVETSAVTEVLAELGSAGIWLPVVAVHVTPEVESAVAAIKAGALDYLALPLTSERLAELADAAAHEIEGHADARRRMVAARNRLAGLSRREHQVLDRLAEGNSNKAIAQALKISPRTVEIHRASMMRKLGAHHAAEAVRLRLEARLDDRERKTG